VGLATRLRAVTAGARLASWVGVRLVACMTASALAVGYAAGCHAPAAPRPAAHLRCAGDRIGRVAIEGAPVRAVAPLAVLAGTLDDPPRTERVRRLVIALLHATGYPRATIAVRRHAGCGTELDVLVRLGPHRSRPPTRARAAGELSFAPPLAGAGAPR